MEWLYRCTQASFFPPSAKRVFLMPGRRAVWLSSSVLIAGDAGLASEGGGPVRLSVRPWWDRRAWGCAATNSRVVRVCWCRVLRCCCWCPSGVGTAANRSPKRSAGWNDPFAFLCPSESWKGSDSGFYSGYWFTLTMSWPCPLLQMGYFLEGYFLACGLVSVLLCRDTTQGCTKLADTYRKNCDLFLFFLKWDSFAACLLVCLLSIDGPFVSGLFFSS